MGYISKEHVKDIRQKLKAKFPKVKFSITTENHSTVCICIMESPFEWAKDHEQIYHDYSDKAENAKFLKQITEIANVGVKYRDTGDYGNQPSFYVSLNIGKWNKPHIKI